MVPPHIEGTDDDGTDDNDSNSDDRGESNASNNSYAVGLAFDPDVDACTTSLDPDNDPYGRDEVSHVHVPIPTRRSPVTRAHTEPVDVPDDKNGVRGGGEEEAEYVMQSMNKQPGSASRVREYQYINPHAKYGVWRETLRVQMDAVGELGRRGKRRGGGWEELLVR